MTKKEEENFRDKNTNLPKFKWCHLFFNFFFFLIQDRIYTLF